MFSANILLLFSSAVICIQPTQNIHNVDIIEYNSLITTDGEFVFDQWIFWKFQYNIRLRKYRYEIVDWRLARNVKIEDFEIVKQQKQQDANREWCKKYPSGKFILWPDVVNWKLSHDSNGYLLVFNDPKYKGRITKIRSRVYRETYSTQDPELLEREFTPETKRNNILRGK